MRDLVFYATALVVLFAQDWSPACNFGLGIMVALTAVSWGL